MVEAASSPQGLARVRAALPSPTEASAALNEGQYTHRKMVPIMDVTSEVYEEPFLGWAEPREAEGSDPPQGPGDC
jgi:hypothetical protein